MKTITFGSSTHVGRVRLENQDAVGKFPLSDLDLTSAKGQLFVIADGMGGHAGGRQASSLAVETIGERYFSFKGSVLESLKHAFKEANSIVYSFSVNNPLFSGMGSTCIALVLQNDSVYVAHIGDSRLYRITTNAIEQLTKDHSKVAEMVRRGIITDEEARVHPERSMLYRAMGVRTDMQFDLMNNIPLGPDEFFLMCTDGLTGYVEDDELHQTVISYAPQEACEALVAAANNRGGGDNITVQIIHVKRGESFLKTMFRAK